MQYLLRVYYTPDFIFGLMYIVEQQRSSYGTGY